MRSERQIEFDRACAEDDAVAVQAFLDSPDARELFENSSNASLFNLASINSYRVIPLIARKFPEELEKREDLNNTPFLIAANHFKTEAMLALAAAGADIRACWYESPYPGAMLLALTTEPDNDNCTGPDAYKHPLALRSLGLDINEPEADGKTPFRKAIETGSLSAMKRGLDAGGDLYRALDRRRATNPLDSNLYNLGQDLLLCMPFGSEENATAFTAYIKDVLQTAPQPGTPLTPSLFLEPDGAPTKQSLQWEALCILPLYFAPEAAARWQGGLGEMIETAGRMPAYMMGDILPRLQREMPTPRTGTVTATYISGATPQQAL